MSDKLNDKQLELICTRYAKDDGVLGMLIRHIQVIGREASVGRTLAQKATEWKRTRDDHALIEAVKWYAQALEQVDP